MDLEELIDAETPANNTVMDELIEKVRAVTLAPTDLLEISLTLSTRSKQSGQTIQKFIPFLAPSHPIRFRDYDDSGCDCFDHYPGISYPLPGAHRVNSGST